MLEAISGRHGEARTLNAKAIPGARWIRRMKPCRLGRGPRTARMRRGRAESLWGSFIRLGMVYAAIAYSWMRPPSRSCLRIVAAGSVGTGGFGRRGSGGASPSAR